MSFVLFLRCFLAFAPVHVVDPFGKHPNELCIECQAVSDCFFINDMSGLILIIDQIKYSFVLHLNTDFDFGIHEGDQVDFLPDYLGARPKYMYRG